MSRVDFCLPVYKEISLLPNILDMCRQSNIEHTITILDNSEDEGISSQVGALLKNGERHIISKLNTYFVRAVNYLMEETFSEYAVFICPTHTRINDPEWFNPGVEAMDGNERIIMCGDVQKFPGVFHYRAWSCMSPNIPTEKKIPERFFYLDQIPREHLFDQQVQVYVHAGIFMINRKAYNTLGPLDETFIHSMGEAEYSLRALAMGYGLGSLDGVYSRPGGKVPEGDFKAIHVGEVEDDVHRQPRAEDKNKPSS